MEMGRLAVVILLLTFLFAVNAQRYQVNTYTILSPDGGIEECNMCGGQPGQYTCSDNRFQNWNGGVFKFKDGFGNIPSGMQVRVTSYNVTIFGTFGCSASGINSNIALSLNGQILNSVSPQKSSSTCQCGYCDTPVVAGSLDDTFYRYGFANYTINGMNTLVLSPTINYICIQRIAVTVNYTINAKFVQSAYLNLVYNSSSLSQTVCGRDRALLTNQGPTATSISFVDPLPEKSVLVRVRAKVFGGFNCASVSGVTYTLTLQNMKLITNTVPNNLCSGQGFCNFLNFYSEQAYVSGWPDYVYGATNTLRWVQSSWNSDYSFISFIQIAMDYYTTP